MYARRVGDRELTFDFAEGLIKDNLLIVDRETQSVWSQLHGKAVMGPLEGSPLQALPSLQTTWEFWKQKHPETKVMILPDEEGRLYLYRNRRPDRPAEKPETEHDTTAVGLGLVIQGEAIFFPFRELEKAALPVHTTLGGEPIVVHFRQHALTAWAEDEKGNLLTGVLAYERGWRDFFPDTEVFRATEGR